jgi:TRAP-type C4-dicarboxylate transport system permease large subunit
MRRRLTRAQMVSMILDTALTTSTIFFVVIGALIFANLVTASGSAAALQQWVASLNLPQTALILVLLAIYIVLGCMLDASAMTVLTVPIFFPIVTQAGIDPIWFGIFLIIVVGIGMIHPPMGLLLFVVRAFVPDVSVRSVFYGILPYIGGDALRIALLILFPGIVLVLPQMMK